MMNKYKVLKMNNKIIHILINTIFIFFIIIFAILVLLSVHWYSVILTYIIAVIMGILIISFALYNTDFKEIKNSRRT